MSLFKHCLFHVDALIKENLKYQSNNLMTFDLLWNEGDAMAEDTSDFSGECGDTL